MKDDRLDEATRALREGIDGAIDDPRAAEDRLMARLPRARRQRLLRPWGFSLAALLIGSSVWATTRGPLAPWFEELAAPADAASVRVVLPKEHAGGARPSRSESAVGVAAGVEQEPTATVLAAPRVPSTAPPFLPMVVPPEPTGASEPTPAASPTPEPAGSSSVALEVYEQAHELHFVRRDYAGALVAWDRYLELAPAGALALEARFHRAVCLARVGAKDKARIALEPFARGDYGTYRRQQAQKLLEGLERP